MISLVAALSSTFPLTKLFFRTSKVPMHQSEDDFHYVDSLDEEMIPVRAEVVHVTDENDDFKEDDFKRHSTTLWSELPETVESQILFDISKEQITQQEAIYEVIRTEENYLKRLVILQEHFATNLKNMLPPREWKEIFEYVLPILEVSQRFWESLQSERRKSIGCYLPIMNFCRVVQRHAEFDFVFYIRYCSNQIYQQRCLQQLKNNYPVIAEELKSLERNAKCNDHWRTLESYLLLPVQRITLLPLLIEALLKRTNENTTEHVVVWKLNNKIKEIVNMCNERSREIHRNEEMLIAANELDFDAVPVVSLLTQNRWLIKKGAVKRVLFPRASLNDNHYMNSVRLKFLHKELWIFLFSDLIIITRKKKNAADNRFKVLTYCQRSEIVVYGKSIKVPDVVPEEFDLRGFQLCLLQNHENIIEEMILLCEDQESKNTWMELLSNKSKHHFEVSKVYHEWDYPQVRVKIPYVPQKMIDLPLDVGDLIDVKEKRADGWCYGVKCGTSKTEGWFLHSHVEKSPSVYERAKILRRNYQRARRRILLEKSNKGNNIKRSSFFSH